MITLRASAWGKPPAAFGEQGANASDRLVLTGQALKSPQLHRDLKLCLFMAITT